MNTLCPITSAFVPADLSDGFAPWSRLSKVLGRLNRAFGYIGKDPGVKTVHFDLGREEGNLIFSLDGGSVGHALMDTSLINSAGRIHNTPGSGLTKNRYRLTKLSGRGAHLDAYRGPRHYMSWKVDLLI
jgi:hypothetical protein